MENISHSLPIPKRSFAFTSHKSVYDDVFRAAPPKLGLPTQLAPRLEDYSEIFVGASRSFSIPVLDLPLLIGGDGSDSNLLLRFDYTEVFGDSGGGVAFASSFEDLAGQSSGGYDSSDEPWSPAQSGSLSDEFDPLARSDESLRLSDGDAHQSLETTKQFNASYNKSSQSNIGTVLTGTTSHVTNFSALPGYTFSHYESPVSWDGEDENCSVNVIDDLNGCKEYGKRVTEEKQYTKCSANPVHSGFNAQRNDFNLSEKHENSTSKPFMTVSDISLRTKPLRLPPPSRPPPALVVKKGDSDRSDLKLKASKSYAFERVADDSASPFFDVEVVANLSPEGRENGNKNVKAKHESTKECIESMPVEEKTNTTARVSISIKDEKMAVVEDRIESMRGAEDISGSQGSANNYAGAVAWSEATEYFEVIEKNISMQAFDIVENCDTSIQHMDPDAYRHRRATDTDTLNQQEGMKKLKVSKEAQGLEKERRQPEITSELNEIPNTRLSEQKGFQEEVIPNKLASQHNLHMMVPENIQQFGESERLQTDHCETVEVLPEGEGNLSEVGARSRLKATPVGMDIEKRFIDAQITKQNSEKHKQNILREERQRRLENVEEAETRDQQLACEVEKDKERLMEAGEQIKNELTYRDSLQQGIDGKEHKLVHEREVTTERNGDASKAEENGLRFRRADTDAGNMSEVFETKRHINLSRAAGEQKELSGHIEEIEPIERIEHEREVEWDLDSHVLIEEDQLKEFDGGCKLDEPTATTVSGKQNNEGKGQLKVEPNSIIYETGARVDDTLVKGKSNGFNKNKNELQGRITEKIMSTENDRGQPMKGTQFISKRLDVRDSFTPCQMIRESTVNGRKVDDASSVLKHSDDTLYSMKNAISEKIERKDYNIKEKLVAKDQKVGERIRREIELENEHIRKIEEEKEREREREKDRMAVDQAAIQARERSYAEARERAAVERATAEVRQRAMVGARERLEKASMETKLRAERAAVERATAEARQRAAEKLMAQQAASKANDRVERSVPDRFPASFRYADARQSSLPSDIHLQSTGISNSLRYSYSFAHAGADGESPQRCKARLERYRRTAERAANALAEKNRRDLLAQSEREERNRVAEALDAEIKRWSSGKEANLRALLSTLQYILGPDSGWQPVPLTEVITSAAVRKAYRKATLCVHPDKLQQRGATIQQKYICEKVFDLLKEAWNKFNSEER